MGLYIKLLSIFLFISALFSSAFAQGQLFTRDKANQSFGPVLTSVDIPISTFLVCTNQPNNNQLMFRIQNGQVVILDGKRNVLYPGGINVNSQDVFTVFSISVVNELLSNGNGSFITVEQRKEVLSISYDQGTMEVGTQCPPFCLDN